MPRLLGMLPPTAWGAGFRASQAGVLGSQKAIAARTSSVLCNRLCCNGLRSQCIVRLEKRVLELIRSASSMRKLGGKVLLWPVSMKFKR